jgi:Xaa-Pro aminopeptidase
MTQQLSPVALAIWEAFNEDEAGVFVDYGDKLAAALRALAAQFDYAGAQEAANWTAAIATELSSANNTNGNTQ